MTATTGTRQATNRMVATRWTARAVLLLLWSGVRRWPFTTAATLLVTVAYLVLCRL